MSVSAQTYKLLLFTENFKPELLKRLCIMFCCLTSLIFTSLLLMLLILNLFLQLCDSQSLRHLVDNQDSLTLTLSVGSLKGGGKNKRNSGREVG